MPAEVDGRSHLAVRADRIHLEAEGTAVAPQHEAAVRRQEVREGRVEPLHEIRDGNGGRRGVEPPPEQRGGGATEQERAKHGPRARFGPPVKSRDPRGDPPGQPARERRPEHAVEQILGSGEQGEQPEPEDGIQNEDDRPDEQSSPRGALRPGPLHAAARRPARPPAKDDPPPGHRRRAGDQRGDERAIGNGKRRNEVPPGKEHHRENQGPDQQAAPQHGYLRSIPVRHARLTPRVCRAPGPPRSGGAAPVGRFSSSRAAGRPRPPCSSRWAEADDGASPPNAGRPSAPTARDHGQSLPQK